VGGVLVDWLLRVVIQRLWYRREERGGVSITVVAQAIRLLSFIRSTVF